MERFFRRLRHSVILKYLGFADANPDVISRHVSVLDGTVAIRES